MPFQIVRNDITKVKADAIVNTANPNPIIGGGTDRAIYLAAGAKRLLEERQKIGVIKPGQAAVTPAFDLEADYIIHTVGPIWIDGSYKEEETLAKCYKNSLKLAVEYGCESVAFPLISAGVYRFPHDKAIKIAVREITDFILEYELMVYIVLFDRKAVETSQKLTPNIDSFINDEYVEKKKLIEHPRRYGISLLREREFNEYRTDRRESREEAYEDSCDASCDDGFLDKSADREPFAPSEPMMLNSVPEKKKKKTSSIFGEIKGAKASVWKKKEDGTKQKTRKLEDVIQEVDETFQQAVMRMIDEKGVKPSAVYRAANLTKQHWAKIKADEAYQPKRSTAICICLALNLNLDETKDMLARAGYAFSPSKGADRLVEECIRRSIFSVMEIDLKLESYNLPMLSQYPD